MDCLNVIITQSKSINDAIQCNRSTNIRRDKTMTNLSTLNMCSYDIQDYNILSVTRTREVVENLPLNISLRSWYFNENFRIHIAK